MLDGCQAARQYWVLDHESQEEVKEDWISKMFKLCEGPSPPSPGSSRGTPKQGKAKKSATAKPKPKRNPKNKNKDSIYALACVPLTLDYRSSHMPPKDGEPVKTEDENLKEGKKAGHGGVTMPMVSEIINKAPFMRRFVDDSWLHFGVAVYMIWGILK